MPWARYQSSPIGRSPGSVRLPLVYTGGCSSTSSRSGIAPAWRRSRSVSCSATPSRYGTVPSCATQSSATKRRLLSGAVDRDERFWPARVRWRLRGAWMWPTFIAITLLDGLIMWRLPPVGGGVDPIPALLIATFGNLALIAAVAPWLARRTWNRRPAAEPGAPPRAQLEVLTDRIGTGLLVATVLGVIVAGLAARPLVVAETEAKERAAERLYSYVQENGSDELRRNLEASDMDKWFDGYFRACIPSDDRRSWTCYLIDVRTKRAKIKQDPSGVRNPLR